MIILALSISALCFWLAFGVSKFYKYLYGHSSWSDLGRIATGRGFGPRVRESDAMLDTNA